MKKNKMKKIYQRMLAAFLVLCMIFTMPGAGTIEGRAEGVTEESAETEAVESISEKETETEAAAPAEPEQAVQEVAPAEPEQPAQEITPVEPEQPAQEVTPAEPEQPVQDVTPEEAEQTDEYAASDEPADDAMIATFAANNIAADKAVDLATKSSGATLSSGAYYLTASRTFGSSGTSNNGLRIASGAYVYIYLPKGVTLTAVGGGTNSARSTGGYAGILLPSNATLVFLGEGTVIATGGRAGNGTSGSSGSNGYISSGSYYYGGAGGSGGAGGGGAGAGIGTNGGTGGSGGSSAGSGSSLSSGSSNYNGSDGGSGYSGSSASSCGTLYKQSSITISATGGGSGSGGGAGSAGSCSTSSSKWDGKQYHVAGGGGGGAGGGAGYSANGIGTGGAGGGGGGAGGSGGTDYREGGGLSTSSVNGTCNGGGGSGGTGSSNGSGGYGSRDSGAVSGKWDKTGGYGGSGGGAGSGSSSKSALTSGWRNNVSYTVSFRNTSGGNVKSYSYTFGTSTNLTVPSYTPATGSIFLGWEIQTYAAAAAVGNALSSIGSYMDTTIYQAGETINVAAGLSGSVVLTPIIGSLGGTSVQTETLSISGSEMKKAATYYTYTVKTTLDGTAADMGNLKLKSGSEEYVITYEKGAYTFITTKNTTYTIYQNGQSLGKTVTANSTTDVAYQSLSITTKVDDVNSTDAGEVTLSGTNAPALTTTSAGEYRAVGLADDKTSYKILVGGMDTGETISLGSAKTLHYYSTQITVNGNTKPGTVVLKENGGKQSYVLNDTADKVYTLIEQAQAGTYTLYVDGIRTSYTDLALNVKNTESLDYNTTTIDTTVNGTGTDMGTVLVGDQQAIEKTAGNYTVTTITLPGETAERELTVADRKIATITLGDTKSVPYYTVEYADGDTKAKALPVDKAVYLENDTVTVQAAVSTEDSKYTFAGWQVQGSVMQPGSTFKMPGKKLTIPVKWDAAKYDITYDLVEEGTVNDTANPETYTFKDTVTLKEPSAEDYIFDGWTYDGVDTPQKEVTIPQGTTGDLTFTAQWTEKTYEINADTQEVDFGSRVTGYSGSAMPAAMSIGITSSGNQPVTIDTPVCDNDNFVIDTTNVQTTLAENGGYTEFTVQPKAGLPEGNYTGTITVSSDKAGKLNIPLSFAVGKDTTAPDADVTIGENSWDDIAFEPENTLLYNTAQPVTIHASDDETGVGSISYYITKEAYDWSEDGEPTDDWKTYDSTDKPVLDGDGTYYVYAKVTDKESPENVTYVATDAVTLDLTAPEVSFVDKADGTLTDGGIYQGKKEIKVTDQRLESVTLDGEACELAEDGSCTFFVKAKEDTVQQIVATDKAGNVTTLRLTVNPYSYQIHYDANGGTGEIADATVKENVSYAVADATGLVAPVGKEFAYWAVGSADSEETVAAGGSYTFEAETTLYAVWKNISYTIAYDLAGGTNAKDNPSEYTIESDTITLSDPEWEGYIFDGWTWLASEGAGEDAQTEPVKDVVIERGSIGNKKFTANWTKKDYTITSDTDHVVYEQKLEYVYGSESVKVTITNGGNWTVNLKAPVSSQSDSSYTIGTLSKQELEPGETASFTIATKEKLAVGTHNEDITVSTKEGTSVTIQVSFTVTADTNAPTGTIQVKDNLWTEFLNTITFGKFYRETQDVILTAEDTTGGKDVNTGVNKICYYLSEKEMTKAELEALDESAWTEYHGKFAVSPNRKLVVYAKITDFAQKTNVTYLSSDGIVLDDAAPVFSGIPKDHYYCTGEELTITVTDEYLVEVTVDDKTITLDNKNSFRLLKEEDGDVTLKAVDKAGNVENITIHFGPHKTKVVKVIVPTEFERGYSIVKCSVCDTEQWIDEDSYTKPTGVSNVKPGDKEKLQEIIKEAEKRLNDPESSLSEEEKQFIEDVKKQAEEKIEKIDQTQEQKKEIEDKLDKLPDIEQITKDDKDKIEDLIRELDQFTEEHEDSLTEDEKKDLEDQKKDLEKKLEKAELKQEIADAKQELEKKAEEAKTAIDAMPELTEEEKSAAKDAITKQVENTIKEIEQITDSKQKDEVTSKKDAALEEIKKQKDTSARTDLTRTKENAVKEIEKKAEEAKKAIDAMPDLTEEEKKAAKEEIEKKAEEAKKAVDQITDHSKKEDVISKQDSVTEAIQKKQDETVAKNNSNAVENKKKAEEAVNKTTDVISNIKISNTDKESIIKEVKTELKKNGLDNVDVSVDTFQKTPATLHEKGKITGKMQVKVGSTVKTITIDQKLPELSTFVTYESKVAKDAPKSDISVDENTLMDNVLTKKELSTLSDGGNADMLLQVENKEAKHVTKAETRLVEKLLDEHTQIGAFLDISLYLSVKDAAGKLVKDKEKIHNPKTTFTIKVSIPKKLRTAGTAKRTYEIIRVHDGKSEILPSKYNEKDQTITFETNKFSTYAIAYTETGKDKTNDTDNPDTDHKKDPDNSDNRNPGDDHSSQNSDGTGNGQTISSSTTNTATVTTSGQKKAVKTGDDTAIAFWIVLLGASALVLLIMTGKKKKHGERC